MRNSRPGTGWEEKPLGGSPEAEEKIINRLVEKIKRVQEENKKHAGWTHLRRGQHVKMHAGINDAEFWILPERYVPRDLRLGFFQPGQTYKAIVRFSNADGLQRADSKPDLRGVAIRVAFDDRPPHDFLLTNAPHNHVENAIEFMIVAEALATKGESAFAKLTGEAGELVANIEEIAEGLREETGAGFFEAGIDALGILKILVPQAMRSANIKSLVTQDYWSRAPFRLGDLAVQFKLQHTTDEKLDPEPSGPDFLREDLPRRLQNDRVVFDVRVQRFVDEETTPIENASKEWDEKDSPPKTIAQLVIPPQDLDPDIEAQVNALEFNPWNNITGPADFLCPVGNMNRARRLVYKKSAELRRRE